MHIYLYTITMKGVDAMPGTTSCNFNVRMDADLKSQCEELYHSLGLNLTTAINIFLRKSLQEGGLPFEVKVKKYNDTTIAAMLEARKLANDPQAKRYDDVNEALQELKR